MDGVAAGGVDLGGAAAGHDADVGVGADDAMECMARRRGGACCLVAEQDDGLFGDVLRVVAALEGIDDGARRGRVIDDAGGEHGAEEAVDHVVEAGLGDLSRLDGLLEGLAEVLVAGHLHVEAGEGGLDGGVGGLPVGDDEAGVVPLVLEDVVQQPIVFAGPVAVDLVVGAHDGGGVADADADLKGEQVGLVRGLVIEVASTTVRPVSWSLKA